MRVPVHGDALALELHPFHLQTQTLLLGGLEPQLDCPARAYDTMPRQPVRRFRAEQASHRAVIKGVARGCRHLAISAYLSRRDRKNGASKCLIAERIWPEAVPQNASVQLPQAWLKRRYVAAHP